MDFSSVQRQIAGGVGSGLIGPMTWFRMQRTTDAWWRMTAGGPSAGGEKPERVWRTGVPVEENFRKLREKDHAYVGLGGKAREAKTFCEHEIIRTRKAMQERFEVKKDATGIANEVAGGAAVRVDQARTGLRASVCGPPEVQAEWQWSAGG